MRLLMWMQPRSRAAAVRTLMTLAGVAALITVVFLPIQPGRRDPTPVEVGADSRGGRPGHRRLLGGPRPAHPVPGCLGAGTARGGRSHRLDGPDHGGRVGRGADLLYLPDAVRRVAAAPRRSDRDDGRVGRRREPSSRSACCRSGRPSSTSGTSAAALVTTAVILIRGGERQAELIDKLERLAAIDPLTGLATRRVLDEAAQSAISGSHSVEGTSLILLDVDNFKSINDRHGHPGGDEVLVQLADLLMQSARHDDVVCRIGGDEMALLLPGCSVSSLRRRAHQIVAEVRAATSCSPTVGGCRCR